MCMHIEESEKLNKNIIIIISNYNTYWVPILGKHLDKFLPIDFSQEVFYTVEEIEAQRSFQSLPKSPIRNRIESTFKYRKLTSEP